MKVLWKILLWSWLCCLLATPVQAQQAGQDQGTMHQGTMHQHPPQDRLLHEKFYSKLHMPDNPSVSCCNDADCYPTEMKYVGGDIYARRREDGKYILIPPQKVEHSLDNPDGQNHLCAPPPSMLRPSDTVYCFTLGGAT